MYYLLCVLLYLTTVTKTITTPITLNFSPADIICPVIFVHILYRTLKDGTFRSAISQRRSLIIFIGLILWRVSTLMFSFSISNLISVQSLVINIFKTMLILGYAVIGYHIAQNENQRKMQVFISCIVFLFSAVGVSAAILHIPKWGIESSRLISTVNDPNMAGFIILVGLLFSWKLWESASWKEKLTLIMVICVEVMALLLTGSRTAYLGLGILLLMVLFSQERRIVNGLAIVSMSVLLISSSLIIDLKVSDGKYYENTVRRAYSKVESASDYRNLLRSAGFEMGLEHPIIGVGTGQFPNFSNPYLEKQGEDISSDEFIEITSNKVAHNTYVTLFAESGLIALMLFLLVIYIRWCESRVIQEKAFLLLIVLYCYLFNLENVRFVWLMLGLTNILDCEVDIKKRSSKVLRYSRLSILVFGGILIIAILNMPPLWRFVPLIDQTVQIEIDEQGVEVLLEFDNLSSDKIIVSFDGPDQKQYVISNSIGYYYDHFDLKEGKYTVKYSSENGMIKLKYGRIWSGDNDVFFYQPLFGDGNLKTFNIEQELLDQFDLLPLSINEVMTYNDVKPQKLSTVNINKANGVNFENRIALSYSELLMLNENEYELVIGFEKIGEIDSDYTLMCRGINLSGMMSETELIGFNFDFEDQFEIAEVGEILEMKWKINTEGQPYMLYFGFLISSESDEYVRSSPRYIRIGYIE